MAHANISLHYTTTMIATLSMAKFIQILGKKLKLEERKALSNCCLKTWEKC